MVVSGAGAALWQDLCLPYGDVRHTWRNSATLALQTGYRYTSQRMEAGVGAPSPVGGLDRGLYDYNARWYDPALGHFLSPDALVPEAGNALDSHRYAYVRFNPLKYTDPSGHCPWCIPVALGVLKLVDYGWTTYDTWHAGRILANPQASDEDKLIAGLTVALAGLEVLEPDDFLPASLPLDDVARRAVTGGAQEAFQQGGLRGGVQFLRGALGEAAPGVIRNLYDQGMFRDIRSAGEWQGILQGMRKEAGLEVHHLIEQRFAPALGLDPDSIPSIVLTKEQHQVFTNAWRAKIGYITDNTSLTTANATREDIWAAAQQIYRDHPDLLEAVRQSLLGR